MSAYSGRHPLVGINAHLISDQAGYRRAGIHEYISQLVRHLPAVPGGPRYLVYTRARRELDGLPLVGTRWPTERRLARIAWEHLAWPLAARRRGVDLLHGLAFVTPVVAPCPTLVTVYDLSFIHFPERFPAAQRLYLTYMTRLSCRKARRVVAISEATRQDVHARFAIPLDRIDVVTPGVGPAFRPRPATEVSAFRRREGLPAQFILHVGTLQPRKNIPTLIDAFARLAETGRVAGDACLVLVGGKGWMYDEIFARVERHGLARRVRFAGYVPDEDLPLWYNAASLVVVPSVYEGFGLPIVEAMASGTPTAVADSGSLPEVGGAAVALFDPRDVAALANRMADVLADPDRAATMSVRGLAQARRFSWEASARRMTAVYQQALRGAAVDER